MRISFLFLSHILVLYGNPKTLDALNLTKINQMLLISQSYIIRVCFSANLHSYRNVTISEVSL